MDFQGFGKISRLYRGMVVTEKIDGTNGQLAFEEDGTMQVGSRNQWITPLNDNHGFANWATLYREELFSALGPGRHFGEWWGQGIQRRYDMPWKVFSLFNTSRWAGIHELKGQLQCVPILAEGTWNEEVINITLHDLAVTGSVAAPGFENPEGVVAYHTGANVYFKHTFDPPPKGN